MQFTLFMACAKCSSLKLFLRLVSPANMFNPEYRRASFKYILSFEDIAPLNLVFLKAFKDSNDLFVVQRSWRVSHFLLHLCLENIAQHYKSTLWRGRKPEYPEKTLESDWLKHGPHALNDCRGGRGHWWPLRQPDSAKSTARDFPRWSSIQLTPSSRA